LAVRAKTQAFFRTAFIGTVTNYSGFGAGSWGSSVLVRVTHSVRSIIFSPVRQVAHTVPSFIP